MRTFLFPLMIGDLILGFGAIYIAFSLSLLGVPWVSNEDAARTMVFLLVVLSSSFVTEIYSYDKRLDRTEIGLRILFAISLCFFFLAAVDFLFPDLVFELRVTVISLFSFGFLQFLWHAIYRTWDRMSGFANRVIILGTGPLAHQMGQLLKTPNHHQVLVGYFNCSNKPAEVPADKLIGSSRDGLFETAKRLKANKVVVSLTERRGVFPLQEILSCKLSGIQVQDAPNFYEQMTGSLLLEHITPSWFIFSEGFRVTTMRRVLKRMMDVVCALSGILLVSPLLPLLALAIRLDSRGPVIYSQLRVGEGDRNFKILKFRTMDDEAEQQTGAVWAGEDDPRITRVGRFLRKTRLDEIPQLFNVLNGDMSFVGPRPERPEFVAMLKEVIPYYSERHFVKPGITGWAQVSYPYGASVEDAIEKLRYDLYYIKNLCGLLDIFIIIKTIHVVLFGKGGR
jgi:sugar transferase (PEP-CTERM system associated)